MPNGNDVKAVVKCKLLLYADDSALLASSSDVSEIEEILKRELESVSEWLAENRLSLHFGKTESILFAQTNEWLSVIFVLPFYIIL